MTQCVPMIMVVDNFHWPSHHLLYIYISISSILYKGWFLHMWYMSWIFYSKGIFIILLYKWYGRSYHFLRTGGKVHLSLSLFLWYFSIFSIQQETKIAKLSYMSILLGMICCPKITSYYANFNFDYGPLDFLVISFEFYLIFFLIEKDSLLGFFKL